MQRIRFGLTLDGERGWHPRDALGESTVGPLGLLSILETQLGLSRLAPSHAERIVQMRGCLKAACKGTRSYEKSFQVDEFGTAAAILAWRDVWHEHGWKGSVPADSSTRLQDMSAADALAQSQVSWDGPAPRRQSFSRGPSDLCARTLLARLQRELKIIFPHREVEMRGRIVANA